MVEADQFMMRVHQQLVPQPPLGRGGSCEASPLYSCCPPLQKSRRSVSVSVSAPKSTSISKSTHSFVPTPYPHGHSVCFGNYLMQSMRSSLSRLWTWACMIKWYRDIHLFGPTVNQQCQNAASGTRRILRGIARNTHDEGGLLLNHMQPRTCAFCSVGGCHRLFGG